MFKDTVKLLSTLSIGMTLTGIAAFALPGHVEGTFLTGNVEKEFSLISSDGLQDPAVAAHLIENYIDRNFPNREEKGKKDDLSTADLARRIAGASFCFKIDPFIFTALIRQESINFSQHAVSGTGAVGLTQFTTSGVREVNDQLGIRGKTHALSSTTEYFSSVLTSSCLADAGGFTTMGAQYQPLWDQASIEKMKYTDGTAPQATAMARILDDHPETAIVYGAILLKVKLSEAKSGVRPDVMARKPKPSDMAGLYREALMLYNGDPKAQVGYGKRIVDTFYPEIVGKIAQ